MNGNVVFWFRRDLRLNDNMGLLKALHSGHEVIPLFIFDNEIVDELEVDDPRISFILEQLGKISAILSSYGSGMIIKRGKVADVLNELISKFNIISVFANEDYEPYPVARDKMVSELLAENNIPFECSPDHLVFPPGKVLKNDGNPYTVYTPYSRKWLGMFSESTPEVYDINPYSDRFSRNITPSGTAPDTFGFRTSDISARPFDISPGLLSGYVHTRNTPALNGTSNLGPHLRFGTVSIREVARLASGTSEIFLKELVWREFFMQILYYYPYAVSGSFKPKYDRIEWRNNEDEFERWCSGTTGYPMVDAGMRELNTTGYMHNRVRMITAGFLTKHLLIDWRWGEAYFARKLLDYELSSNNGNWQWAAGSGCDAAPYFRIFNPYEQQKKFDPSFAYIRRWIPEFNTSGYPEPVVEHQFARRRALEAYSAIN